MALNLSVLISGTDKLSGVLRGISGEMQELQAQQKGVTITGTSLTDALNKITAVAGPVAAGLTAILAGTIAVTTAMTIAGKAVLETSGNFEVLEMKLRTAVKSTAVANDLMDFAKQFAAKSPFDLQEVVDATVRLENYGLTAQEWLPLVGDMAGAMGRSVTDAVEAVADAMSGGGLERLKEFGISSAKLREFGWSGDYSAQGILSLRDALKSIMAENFGGGMEALASTMQGKLSNLSDAWINFKDKLGDSVRPVIMLFIQDLTDLIDKLGELADALNALLYGKEVAEGLKELDEQAKSTREEIKGLQEALGLARGALNEQKTEVEKLADKYEDLKEKTQNAADGVTEAQENIREVSEKNADAISDAQDAVAEAYEKAAKAANDAKDRIIEADNKVIETQERNTRRLKDALEQQTKVGEQYLRLRESISERLQDADKNVAKSQERVSDAEKGVTEARSDRNTEMVDTIIKANERLQQEYERINDRIKSKEEQLAKLIERRFEMSTPMSEQQKRMWDLAKNERDITKTSGELDALNNASTGEFQKAYADAQKTINDKREQLDEQLINALDRLSDAVESQRDAQEQRRRTQRDARYQLSDYERYTIPDAVRNVKDTMIDNSKSLADAKSAADKARISYAETLDNNTKSIADAQERLLQVQEDSLKRINDAWRSYYQAQARYNKAAGEQATFEQDYARKQQQAQTVDDLQKQLQDAQARQRELEKQRNALDATRQYTPAAETAQKVLGNAAMGTAVGTAIGTALGAIGGGILGSGAGPGGTALGVGLGGALGGAIGGAAGGAGGAWLGYIFDQIEKLKEKYGMQSVDFNYRDALPPGMGGSRVRVDLAPGLQGKINDANARINTQINNTQAARNVSPAY